MQDPRTAYAQPPFIDEHQQSIPGEELKLRHPADHGEESYRGRARLSGRKALITGGDSGIGRAVAIAYAKEGADVAIAYWQEDEDARETCAQVERAGRKAAAIRCDLAQADECRRAVAEAQKALGGLDVLVNNAAYQGEAVDRFEDLSGERIDRTFRTNIIAMFHLIQAALPHLPAGASIINTSSVQGFMPSASILDYAVTKGAIATLTRGLAQELINRGIRVNSVAPGPVWTPLPIQSFSDDKIQSFGEKHHMGRPAQPIEMASAFVFLASDEASYINGEILNASGGKPY